VYYVADDREASLQRAALASEIARLLPGFADVGYLDWDALFGRWWRDARPGMVLALDEFPSLVASGREVPSLLQKRVDQGAATGVHLVLSGSSRRMMQGLVLDRTAPLFGRATEVLRIGPWGRAGRARPSACVTSRGWSRPSRCGEGCLATGSSRRMPACFIER
jgi:hypothetical protein